MLVKAKQPPEDRAQLPEGMTHGVCTQKTLDTQPRPDPRASYRCLWDQTQGQRVGKNAQVSFCEMRHPHYLQAGEGGKHCHCHFSKFSGPDSQDHPGVAEGAGGLYGKHCKDWMRSWTDQALGSSFACVMLSPNQSPPFSAPGLPLPSCTLGKGVWGPVEPPYPPQVAGTIPEPLMQSG